MKITERRLRQLIRQVIKESRGVHSAAPIYGSMAVYATLTVAAAALVGATDVYHILKDLVTKDYCQISGGTDPVSDPEDFEEFVKEGLIITVEQMHSGEVLVIDGGYTLR